MKTFVLQFILVVGVTFTAQASIVPQENCKDSINVEALRSKATELQAKSNELKPKAIELKNMFDGYKARAKGKDCNKAMKEASDGLDMAQEAVKDCETVDKLLARVMKAKKPEDVKKMVDQMDKRVKNAKYFIHQAEDRKKEAEFELKGCN